MESQLLTLIRSLEGLCNRLSVCLSVHLGTIIVGILPHFRPFLREPNLT
jgi:hypothetical protein